MPHLISNVPYFKTWVRKEFTANHQDYHGEFLHGLVIAVNCMPDRSLSFQIVFTGCEAEDDEPNVHGGAMWARMPIQGLVADIPLDKWPDRMENHLCQPWDCMSREHEVVVLDRTSSSPWYAKIALPNNRVRVTNPALWVTGEGAPDFAPSQWTHSSEEHESYTDPHITFNNLYKD